MHTNTSYFFISEKVRQFTANCAYAENRIRRANTIADVIRDANVNPDALIRFLGNVRSLQQRLHSTATAKATELVQALTLKLETTDDNKLASVMRESRLVLTLLRGNFPPLFLVLNKAIQAKAPFKPKPATNVSDANCCEEPSAHVA